MEVEKLKEALEEILASLAEGWQTMSKTLTELQEVHERYETEYEAIHELEREKKKLEREIYEHKRTSLEN